MTPEQFEYYAPRSLDEALDLLQRYGTDAKLLAGGQSLLAAMKLRLATPKVLIDLHPIAELRGIQDHGDHLDIGAMTAYVDVQDAPCVQQRCPLLPQTIATIGDPQIRNRGTVGGGLAHADPAGDLPAAALALDARLRAISPRGERWLDITDFFRMPYTTSLEPDEILTHIRVPALNGHQASSRRALYVKAARRPSDFPMVGVAALATCSPDQICQDLALAITGVGDHPYRATAVEDALRGIPMTPHQIEDAAAAATRGIDVASDIHASADYRAHLTRVFVTRALHALRPTAEQPAQAG